MGLLLSPVPHGTILKAGYTAFQGFGWAVCSAFWGCARVRRALRARAAHVRPQCVLYNEVLGAISGVTIPKTRGPTHPTAST